MSSNQHPQVLNDPTGALVPYNHPPGFSGTGSTYAARIAYPTGQLRDGDLWKESDTGNLYLWDALTSTWVLDTFATQTPLSGIQNGVIAQAVVTEGDSYAASQGATAGYGYMDLAAKLLNRWYPTVNEINYGAAGASSQDVLVLNAATHIANIPAYGYGPLGWLSINVGINNLRYTNNAKYVSLSQGPSCCLNGNNAVALAASYFFKNDVQAIVNLYQAVWPNAIISLCTIVDPSNGGAGPDTEFNGWTGGYANYTYAITAYNARIKELCNENNYVYCDMYTAAYGHTTWYGPDNLHLNNTGAGGMAIIQEKSFLASVGGNMDGSLPYNLVSNIQNVSANSFSVGPNGTMMIPGRLTLNSGIRCKIRSGSRLRVG